VHKKEDPEVIRFSLPWSEACVRPLLYLPLPPLAK